MAYVLNMVNMVRNGVFYLCGRHCMRKNRLITVQFAYVPNINSNCIVKVSCLVFTLLYTYTCRFLRPNVVQC